MTKQQTEVKPAVTLCRECAEEILPGTPEARDAYASRLHAACAPPAPPCPPDVDPVAWNEATSALPQAPRERTTNYELRCRVFVQMFGARKAAKEILAP